MSERWREAMEENVTAGFLQLLDGYRDAIHTSHRNAHHVSLARHHLDTMRVDAARAAVVHYAADLEQRFVRFSERAQRTHTDSQNESSGTPQAEPPQRDTA